MAMTDEYIGPEMPEGEMPPEQEPRPLDILDQVMASDNIAELLDENELSRIGSVVVDEFDLDDESMKPWRERMNSAIDLAKLIKTDKTYPFPKAANVKYPLITTAALQFNAKAYPAIVQSDEMVKVRVYGEDPQGIKAARAKRVGEHMSWQLSVQVEEWEQDTDKLLTLLPIVGTVVRKIWYDPAQMRKRVRLILPGDFVVNDKVKTLADAPRVTEQLKLYPQEIKERETGGTFRPIEYEPDGKDTLAPQEFLEQHRREDLDGDGYTEPYIVTVHKATRKVVRMVADFDDRDVVVNQTDGSIVSIRRGSYFVAYEYLPSLDGGFWGTGLGLLLSDISETINTVINMMLDAGHMASLGGGFVGSEFRIKGGRQQFRPGEWRMVEASGQDIRSAVVPMTFPGADMTLFQLLGLLIEAGKDVASVKDILTGETGGAQMTATTTIALIEQGMAQFTAAYKRIFRALRQEFKLMAEINGKNVTPQEYADFHDSPMQIDPRADYNMSDMDIVPVADPSSITRMQEMARAQFLQQMAEAGLVNPQAASMRMLEAARIDDIEELMPQPDPMQQAAQAMQMQAAQIDLAMKSVGIEKALTEIEELKTRAMKNLAEAGSKEQMARLDMVKLQLEAMRLAIESSLGGSPGGMAGASGNGGPSGQPQMAIGPGAGGVDPGILGGPAGIGGPPLGVPPQNGAMGRPF